MGREAARAIGKHWRETRQGALHIYASGQIDHAGDNPASELLSVIQKEGYEGLFHVSGAFATVIYDSEKGKWYFCRDRFGYQALCYAFDSEGNLLFSDDLAELAGSGLINLHYDKQALADYLTFGYVPAPRSIYCDIRKIKTGEIVCWSGTGTPDIAYSNPFCFGLAAKLGFEQACAETEARLRVNIKAFTQEEQPDFLLSGGIDSSLIYSLAETKGRKAFTIGYDDERYDESVLASEIAATGKAQHVVCKLTPDAIEMLPELMKLAGEPFANSSLLPTATVMKVAAENGARIVFSGDGGDEVFGGYRRYQAMMLRHSFLGMPKLLGLVLRPFRKWLLGFTENRSRLATVKRFLYSLTLNDWEAYLSFQRIFSSYQLAEVLNNQVQEQDTSNRFCRGRGVEQFNDFDLNVYLPEDSGLKTRIAAAYSGVRTIRPLLDISLAKWALVFPKRFRMNRKKGKPVLRSIVGRYLPASVTERRKTGFGTPVASWIRGPWLEEMRGMIRTLDEWDDEHWLNHQTVARLLEEHISGLANHDARLWSLYCLMIWKKSVRVEEK